MSTPMRVPVCIEYFGDSPGYCQGLDRTISLGGDYVFELFLKHAPPPLPPYGSYYAISADAEDGYEPKSHLVKI